MIELKQETTKKLKFNIITTQPQSSHQSRYQTKNQEIKSLMKRFDRRYVVLHLSSMQQRSPPPLPRSQDTDYTLETPTRTRTTILHGHHGTRRQGQNDLHKEEQSSSIRCKSINSRVSKTNAESILNRLKKSLSILHGNAINAFYCN